MKAKLLKISAHQNGIKPEGDLRGFLVGFLEPPRLQHFQEIAINKSCLKAKSFMRPDGKSLTKTKTNRNEHVSINPAGPGSQSDYPGSPNEFLTKRHRDQDLPPKTAWFLGDFSVVAFFSVLIDVKLDKISPQLLLWCQTLEVTSRAFPFRSSCWFCRGLIPHNFEKRTSKVILLRNLTKKSPPMTPQHDGCPWTWLNPLVLCLFGKYQP